MTASEALRPVTRLWWLIMLFGVVTLGVGVFFVVSPHETLTTFAVIAGIFLLVDGVLAIFGSIFGQGESRGLLALIGVLSAIAGLVLIKKPFDTLVVFTLIIGVWFVVAGVVRFVTALALPEGRAGNIFIAILDLVAGTVILAWPDLGLSTLAVIIGIVLILRGILFIARRLAVTPARPQRGQRTERAPSDLKPSRGSRARRLPVVGCQRGAGRVRVMCRRPPGYLPGLLLVPALEELAFTVALCRRGLCLAARSHVRVPLLSPRV